MRPYCSHSGAAMQVAFHSLRALCERPLTRHGPMWGIGPYSRIAFWYVCHRRSNNVARRAADSRPYSMDGNICA